MLSRFSLGIAFAALATGLLATAIAGIAPWVIGTDPACPDQGPASFFLICWLASVAVAAVAIGCLLTAPARNLARTVGLGIAILVPLGAAAFWVAVVIDGIQECGF
jgi:hypothetical protein